MDVKLGILYQKKKVKFKLKTYEVFELLDFVAGICFVNTKGREVASIITGQFVNKVVCLKFEDIDDDGYYFSIVNLGKVFELIDNTVDFLKARTYCMDNFPKLYTVKDDEFKVVENKELIDYLNSTKKKIAFGEEALENETDIAKMYNSIKQTIISQDEPIMKILTSLFKNQKVINSELDSDLVAKLKENIIIYGSTGTGKTEILKRISKLYKVPIVIQDATSLSEVGYAGRNVTDMLEDLYMAADRDIELAQRGILVIDEFDKLAEKPGDTQSHVSRFGVQRALLKLLDGSELYFNNKKFDTSRLTVVALGAFTGIINGDDYSNVTMDDFMKYGIMRELMGRFSKTIAMNPLYKEDIVKILRNSDFSPLNTYKELFKMLDVKFSYDDNFIDYIAELSIAKNSGARSLKTVFDDCISGALFRIFAGEYSEINLVRPSNSEREAYILTKKKK